MKKQLFALFILVSVLTGCSKNDKVKISGEYSTSKADEDVEEIFIYKVQAGKFTPMDTIVLKEGKFTYDFALSEPGVYAIGERYVKNKVYLMPGDILDAQFGVEYKIKASNNPKIHEHFNTWEEKRAAVFKTPGFRRAPLDTKLETVKKFLKVTDSLKNEMPDNQPYSSYFNTIASLEKDWFLLQIWMNPQGIYPAKNELPEEYNGLYKDDKYKNVALSNFYNGHNLSLNYLRYAFIYKYDYRNNRSTLDYDTVYANELKALHDPQIISALALEELVNRKLFGEIFFNKEKIYGPLVSTESDLKTLEQYKEEQINPYLPGVKAPDFVFIDSSGKEATLESFKGKPILIDVWATWCKPCKYEAPFFAKLYDKYKDDFHFMGVSIDKDKPAWEKFIKDPKNPHGWLQLYAGGEWYTKNKSFFDFYQIAGIPRFILIDSEGNLLMYDAYRPSSEDLEKKLKSLKV
ncbi:TlpA disulfide reductase family protein [Zhouia amylolytica]|uniref:TlpA disulfide reductase family protein n=1 Tax=Zhouia amylolytica TaxID=376730 RepID=UPI0020CDC373|nr:TlpA disulfide reductase family protein [Zhouia amylolytica]MCQ0110559.1 AhpC/TSA family protein [Zhouia amylolytica]